jgi:hypothetical protein
VGFDQWVPFQMAMLMPDLVLAVALEFERVGLMTVRHSTEPALNPRTLWRIPPNINVVPFPPPIRRIRAQDVVVLKERRAGNRGRTTLRTADASA